jgi:ADP-heptose:LPS heptosyltransferase
MKRILIVRIDFLGDMVCTTGFIDALKRHWPQAEIHVLANEYNRAVLDGNPAIHAVHSYVYSRQCERNVRPGRLRAVIDRLRLIRRLRRLRFDLAVVPNGGMHKSSIQIARWIGAARWRAHDRDSEFDDRNPEHVATRTPIHEALAGFRLMPEIPAPAIEALRLHVHVDPTLRGHWEQTLGQRTRPRVGLFVCNKAVQRRWSMAKWRSLIDSLQPRADVLVFCDASDRQMAAALSKTSARCVFPPNVREMVAATSLLDVVVSADSAPVHIAAALQVPVAALFEDRPEKYLRWHPVGAPHVVLRAGESVDDIGVEAVECAVDQLLRAHVCAYDVE